jgi:hypothetical protein
VILNLSATITNGEWSPKARGRSDPQPLTRQSHNTSGSAGSMVCGTIPASHSHSAARSWPFSPAYGGSESDCPVRFAAQRSDIGVHASPPMTAAGGGGDDDGLRRPRSCLLLQRPSASFPRPGGAFVRWASQSGCAPERWGRLRPSAQTGEQSSPPFLIQVMVEPRLAARGSSCGS